MEPQEQIADRIESAAARMRLLADLLLAGPALQELNRGAFARMLYELAVTLEQASEATERCRGCPLNTDAEGRP